MTFRSTALGTSISSADAGKHVKVSFFEAFSFSFGHTDHVSDKSVDPSGGCPAPASQEKI
jgi:hypothetical protein